MSGALYDADLALAYTSPTYLPIVALAAGYGSEQATPDLYPTVEVTWRFIDRPGIFTTVIGYSTDWHTDMDAALRVDVFQYQSIYALLGGWPPATPLEAYPSSYGTGGQVPTTGGPVPA